MPYTALMVRGHFAYLSIQWENNDAKECRWAENELKKCKNSYDEIKTR